MGTYGYCAPECEMKGQLTTKSDGYSFGLVFLELISGRRAIDIERPTKEQKLKEADSRSLIGDVVAAPEFLARPKDNDNIAAESQRNSSLHIKLECRKYQNRP
ncbi:hypothetical protein DITRI_Ditri19aG0018400 [Diplodiscus trichospermus]